MKIMNLYNTSLGLFVFYLLKTFNEFLSRSSFMFRLNWHFVNAVVKCVSSCWPLFSVTATQQPTRLTALWQATQQPATFSISVSSRNIYFLDFANRFLVSSWIKAPPPLDKIDGTGASRNRRSVTRYSPLRK